MPNTSLPVPDDWMSTLTVNVTRLPNGCWRYGPDPDKYTPMVIDGKTTNIHRAVYIEMVGPVPSGWHVHHHCYMKACVNPDHLEALSPSDHMALHTWRDPRKPSYVTERIR